MFLEGRAAPVAQGEVFTTSAEGSMTLSGTESRHRNGQPGRRAVARSASGRRADMDPAVSYAG